ncbi:hypothetical protein ACFWIQ_24835 [Kitasatospora sp. NPDC127059]
MGGRGAEREFGAGWQEQTTPETDGGNPIDKTIAYRDSGGTPLK